MLVVEGSGRGQVRRLQLRGVHADLHDRPPRRHVEVGVGEPAGEVRSALVAHGPAGERAADLAPAGGRAQVTGEREVTVGHADRLRTGAQGVEKARGRELGGQPRARPRGPAGS